MSTMVHQLKAEPLDLSDSDSDKLLIEESTCDTVEEERWVRRSLRTRRSSSRFSEYFTGEEEATTSRAAPKYSKNRAEGGKKSTSRISSKVEPEPNNEDMKIPEPVEAVTGEPVDPAFLMSYVEKTKKVILPGQYAVKVPTGPGGQFVNLDGVEYLQSLGYYDNDFLIEEDDVKEEGEVEEFTETKPTLQISESSRKIELATTEKELLRRRVEFEAQRAMMTRSFTNFSHREFEAQAVTKSSVYRIKEVDEPDQFSSASAYSSDEDRDNSDGAGDEIDVTGGSPPPLELPYPKAPVIEILSGSSSPEGSTTSSKARKSSRLPKFEGDGRRSAHNEMEKIRRQQLADLFVYLKETVAFPDLEIHWADKMKTSKVKLLGESCKVIAELDSQARMCEQLKTQLTEENASLRARYTALEAVLKGLQPRRHLKRLISKQTANAEPLAKQPRLVNSDKF